MPGEHLTDLEEVELFACNDSQFCDYAMKRIQDVAEQVYAVFLQEMVSSVLLRYIVESLCG